MSILMVPLSAAGAVLTVNGTDDETTANGSCSLRDAVRAANTNLAVDTCAAGSNTETDEIVLPAGTFLLSGAAGENDSLSGDLDVTNNAAALDLIITGAGAADTIIQTCSVAQKLAPCPVGQGTPDRAIHMHLSSLTVRDLTIRNGRGGQGGGIFNSAYPTAARLNVLDAVIADNRTSSDGGGLFSDGELVILRSTIRDNDANTRGGGVYSDNAGLVEITASTVSGNTAVNAGGGVITLNGVLNIINSTISGNSAQVNGGGIFKSGDLLLASSTITGNAASVEYAGYGGGIYTASGTSVVRSSIVAGNFDIKGTSKSPDCYGGVTSQGYNVVGAIGDSNAPCNGMVDGVSGDQAGTVANPLDPGLAALADNGGPTLTHALLPGSPAIDAGSPLVPGSSGACPQQDQRGIERGDCDAGAFELSDLDAPLALVEIHPSSGATGAPIHVIVQGTGFAEGALVKLTREGENDIVGAPASIGASGTVIATILDLAEAAAGAWNVVVTNPDLESVTLPNAFTVQAGGVADPWVEIITRRGFRRGRPSTVQLVYGNRGDVDARAVPISIEFPREALFRLRFRITPPPAQPGQVATEWMAVAITAQTAEDANRVVLPLLLPLVPAGFTGVLELALRPPVAPSDLTLRIGYDIDAPYYQPELGPDVVEQYVTQAKARAARISGTTVFPDDEVIAAYVTNQVEEAVAMGSAAFVSDIGRTPLVFSITHLVIDTAQFIAANGQADAREPDSMDAQARAELAGPGHVRVALDWITALPRMLISTLFEGAAAEARQLDPACVYDEFFGECPEADCEGQPEIGICEPEEEDVPEVPYEIDWCTDCDGQEVEPPFFDSYDPNDKTGPGAATQHYISGEQPLPYTIFFENVETASAPAQEVTVTDQLDTASLDLTTLSLGPVTFGDTVFTPTPGLSSFTADVDLRPGTDLIVRIQASLDEQTGVLTWRFSSLDPATGELTEDPLAGFLPPNLTPPAGDGSVSFSVSMKSPPVLATMTCNDASIVFDFNAPILTPQWCVTVGTPPVTTTLPTTTTTAPPALCGDANSDGQIKATDALRILQAAVGIATSCPLALCDVDDSGSIVASDALRVLRAAVGFDIELNCPAA